jgi:hypothetical protein
MFDLLPDYINLITVTTHYINGDLPTTTSALWFCIMELYVELFLNKFGSTEVATRCSGRKAICFECFAAQGVLYCWLCVERFARNAMFLFEGNANLKDIFVLA